MAKAPGRIARGRGEVGMNGGKSILEVEGLTIRFGGLVAVSDVTFQQTEGEILSIIGPNGAGKTTIFNMMTGFYKPTAGDIRYRGQSTLGLPTHAISDLGIIRTFQKTMVFPKATVRDGVLIGLHQSSSVGWWEILWNSARKIKEDAGLQVEADRILEFTGLADKAHMEARNLPYGEQRLLEIAVGLAPRPDLLLLDEPASGMNAEESAKTLALIRRIRETGITVLLVEHNMRVVMDISDRIVVLDHGEKIAEGRPEEIQSNAAVIKAYLGEGFQRA
jgi:branched-chain amino acid transport system ATP-binding protein